MNGHCEASAAPRYAVSAAGRNGLARVVTRSLALLAALVMVIVHSEPAEAARGKARHTTAKKSSARAAKATPARPATARKRAAHRGSARVKANRHQVTSRSSSVEADDSRSVDRRDRFFIEARRAFAQADGRALEALDRPAADHPLADYPTYWRLALALRSGTAGSTDADVEQFISTSGNRFLVETLREDWIRQLARRERWDDVVTQGKLLLGSDDRAVQCFIWQAQIMRGATLPAEARDWLLSPRELGEGCNSLLVAAQARGQLSREDLIYRLRLSSEIGGYSTGRRAAALLDMDSGDLAQALRSPSALLNRGSRDTEAVLIALAAVARNDPEEAAQQAQAVKLPADAMAFAWAIVGAQGAQRLAPQSIDWVRRGINARVSDETRAWMARSALAAGDWSLLRDIIGKMSAAGRADPTWVYWLARAQRELKQPDSAQSLLKSIAGQWSFYGHLAAEELGQSVPPPPEPRPVTEAEAARARQHPGLVRALRLYELDLRADGNREWNFAVKSMSDRELIATADLACRLKLLDRCVNTADRTRHEHKLSLRFLAPFRDRLAQFAQEHRLDPAWVYGLIRQESRFQLQARSHVGAQGLMQIMPKTGSWIARQLGHAGFSVSDLNDVDTNLRFGTYYLRDVTNRLEQSEVMASAGYNAGPGRPARWRQALPGTTDGAVFAEIIPFNETRDYVKKVLWNATWYATLFTGQPQSLKARLGQISPRTTKLTKPDEPPLPPERDAAPVQDAIAAPIGEIARGDR